MTKFSKTFKEELAEKVLLNPQISQKELAKRNNVSYSSLKKWVHDYRNKGATGDAEQQFSKQVKQHDKVRMLLETANLDDLRLGSYCRINGIYKHQLEQWREELMAADPKAKEKKYRNENKTLKTENKRLLKELRRKEKALAEASALLFLKKKAATLWGDNEDD